MFVVHLDQNLQQDDMFNMRKAIMSYNLNTNLQLVELCLKQHLKTQFPK